MNIVPFEPEHLHLIDVQLAQIGAVDIIENHPDYGRMLAASGDCYSVVVDGKVMVSAGVLKLDDGRAIAWAIFAKTSGRHFVRICRYIRRYLAGCGIRRVEASIDTRFKEGVRLAQMMGFEIEGTMRQYGRDGGDHYMMARV